MPPLLPYSHRAAGTSCEGRTTVTLSDKCDDDWCRASFDCYSNATMRSLRDDSLACLYNIAENNGDFGTNNNGDTTEYDTSYCFDLDDVVLPVAEPENTRTGLVFDEFVCDTVTTTFSGTAISAPYLREVASHLAFGTYAQHASGGLDIPNQLDDAGMRCTFSAALKQFMDKTGTSYSVSDGENSFNYQTMVNDCESELRSAIPACNLGDGSDSLSSRLSSMLNGMPSLDFTALLIGYGTQRMCYGEKEAKAVLTTFAEEFNGQTGEGLSDCPDGPECEAIMDFSFESPSWGSGVTGVAKEATFCLTATTALTMLGKGMAMRDGESQQHDQWHLKAAETMQYIAKAIYELP